MSDIDYLLWWQGIRAMTEHHFDALAWHLSDIGNWFESFFVPAVVYWAIDRKTGVFCNLARNLALVFTQFLKTSICAYRPWVRDARIVPIKDALPSATGFSFPERPHGERGQRFRRTCDVLEKHRVPLLRRSLYRGDRFVPQFSGRPHPAGCFRRSGGSRFLPAVGAKGFLRSGKTS